MQDKKGSNDEEIKIDLTPMIDVVFLLIIFFLLMPPKILEEYLESKPSEKGGGALLQDDFIFKIEMRAEEERQGQQWTSLYLNHERLGAFQTLSKHTLLEIASSGAKERKGRLRTERNRDEQQFDPERSALLNQLLKQMMRDSKGFNRGKDVKVVLDVQDKVQYKIVLAILNACSEHFPQTKLLKS